MSHAAYDGIISVALPSQDVQSRIYEGIWCIQNTTWLELYNWTTGDWDWYGTVNCSTTNNGKLSDYSNDIEISIALYGNDTRFASWSHLSGLPSDNPTDITINWTNIETTRGSTYRFNIISDVPININFIMQFAEGFQSLTCNKLHPIVAIIYEPSSYLEANTLSKKHDFIINAANIDTSYFDIFVRQCWEDHTFDFKFYDLGSNNSEYNVYPNGTLYSSDESAESYPILHSFNAVLEGSYPILLQSDNRFNFYTHGLDYYASSSQYAYLATVQCHSWQCENVTINLNNVGFGNRGLRGAYFNYFCDISNPITQNIVCQGMQANFYDGSGLYMKYDNASFDWRGDSFIQQNFFVVCKVLHSTVMMVMLKWQVLVLYHQQAHVMEMFPQWLVLKVLVMMMGMISVKIKVVRMSKDVPHLEHLILYYMYLMLLLLV